MISKADRRIVFVAAMVAVLASLPASYAAVRIVRFYGVSFLAASGSLCASGETCIYRDQADNVAKLHRATNVVVELGGDPPPRSRTCSGTIPRYALVKYATVAGRVAILATSDSPDAVVGVNVGGPCVDGGSTTVQEVQGVETPLLSDGTSTFAVGDAIEPSTTTDGRVKKGSFGSGAVVASATSAQGGGADSQVNGL